MRRTTKRKGIEPQRVKPSIPTQAINVLIRNEEQTGRKKKEQKERRLIILRNEIAVAWTQREVGMWESLVTKTNMQRDPKTFWQEIHRMLGRRKPEAPVANQDEHNHKLTTHIEIAEAFCNRLFSTFRISVADNLKRSCIQLEKEILKVRRKIICRKLLSYMGSVLNFQ